MSSPSIIRTASSFILMLFGALFSFYGVAGLALPWIVHARIPLTTPQLLSHLAISLSAAFVGLAVVLRFRVAAIVLSAWFAYLEALQLWGTIHGFYLPRPLPYSAVDIGVLLILALLPASLTIFAWKALR